MGVQTMEKNRLQIMPKELSTYIKPILTTIKKQLEKIDNKLLNLVVSNKDFKT